MITVIDCGSEKAADIAAIVTALGHWVQLIELSSLNEEILAASHGFIISGNPELITKSDSHPWLSWLGFVTTTHHPVLGICFGHQAIGMLFGARVFMGKEDRQIRSIQLVGQNPLFTGLPNPAVFCEDHCEEVSLPEDFELLATSALCGNEAMQHRGKPIWGVQFHPEVSGPNGRRLIENFCKTCAPA